MGKRYPCSCCSFWTLEQPQYGSYEICPVCFWEDDPVQNSDPEFKGGANNVSLRAAQQNFIDFGAAERPFLSDVRSPQAADMPPVRTTSGLEKDSLDELQRCTKIQVLGIVRGMLSAQIGLIERSCYIALLRSYLETCGANRLDLFEGVASEADDFPMESAHQFWERNALGHIDEQIVRYQSKIRETVLNECRIVEHDLRLELLGELSRR